MPIFVQKKIFLKDYFLPISFTEKNTKFFFVNSKIKKTFIRLNPSLKERAWFTGSFGGGAFHLDSQDEFYVSGLDCLKSIDRGIFFFASPKLQRFLCKNDIVVSFDTFSDRKNFLPLPEKRHMFLTLAENEKKRLIKERYG